MALTIPRVARQSVLAEIETTYGTDVFLTAATSPKASQMMAVFDVSITENAALVENPVMSGRLGNVLPDTVGAISTEITFKQRLRANVAAQEFDANNLPEADPLLRACGMSRTISGGSGSEIVTYEPQDSSFESITLMVMGENAPVTKVTGCVGTVNFVCVAGDAVVAEYRFLGAKVSDTDATGIGSVAEAPTAAGTGYAANDILTLAGGVGGTVTVTGETGGVIDTVALADPGNGYTIAAGVATTGGGGTGATIEVLTLSDLVNASFSKTPQYPTLKSATFTLDSITTFNVQNFNVDLGNVLDAVESMNAASAVVGYFIGRRSLGGSFDPEKVKTVTGATAYDFDSKWQNANMLAWSLQAGAVQYNKVALSGTNLQIIQKGHGARGEKQTFDLTFKLFLDTSVAGMQLVFS